jgi:hypothetical protein
MTKFASAFASGDAFLVWEKAAAEVVVTPAVLMVLHALGAV